MVKSKKPIGLVLMDQSMVAGLGNIYRAEVLYKVRLLPHPSLSLLLLLLPHPSLSLLLLLLPHPSLRLPLLLLLLLTCMPFNLVQARVHPEQPAYSVGGWVWGGYCYYYCYYCY